MKIPEFHHLLNSNTYFPPLRYMARVRLFTLMFTAGVKKIIPFLIAPG